MDIVGFIISVLALIYLFFKQQAIIQQKREHDEIDEMMEEQERSVTLPPEKKISPQIKENRIPKPPQKMRQEPPISSLEEYRLASQIEKRKLKSTLENRHLKSNLESRVSRRTEPAPSSFPPHNHHENIPSPSPSRAAKAIDNLKNRKDLIIYQVVIDKPKGLKPPT